MGCDLAKLVTLNFGFENGALTESENMALKHSESLFVDERKRKKTHPLNTLLTALPWICSENGKAVQRRSLHHFLKRSCVPLIVPSLARSSAACEPCGRVPPNVSAPVCGHAASHTNPSQHSLSVSWRSRTPR